MNHKPIQKKKDHALRTIFLISLIIHLLFLMMFFATNFQKSLSNAIKTFQEKIQKLPRTELPASLKPRQSNFGTPVMFDSPPKPQENAQEATSKQAEKIHTEMNKVEEADVVPQEKIEEQTPSQSAESKPEEINKPEIFEKKEVQKQKKEAPIQEQAAKTSTTEFTEPEAKKSTPHPKPIQKQSIKQEKLEPIRKIPPQQKNVEPQEPSQPAQPKRNLIAMTKGFLDNLKDKGEDLLKRKGDDNKRPDFSEYKYLSYEARVSWQLQAAWKENTVSAHQRPHEGKAAIEFVIDQNGNIADLKLLQSSGNRDLDTMILENTKRAAPFPPLPEHFKTQHYKTGRMIKVFANNYGF